jgi:hypothetical protein
MLIWINGPFGGGKSQTARELHSRLPGSLICDPEQLGFGLHRMLPPQLRDDFQDIPAWRQGVYEVLDLVIERRLRERAVVHAIQRLRGQPAPLFREAFAMRKLSLCLSRLSEPEFAAQLRTDHMTVPQVAEAIAASAGLKLSPHRGTVVGDRIRWAGRGLRHAARH